MQNIPAVQMQTALIRRMKQLRGIEPQEVYYILHAFLCKA